MSTLLTLSSCLCSCSNFSILHIYAHIHIHTSMEGPPKNRIINWNAGPLVVQTSHTRWVFQEPICMWCCCERLHLASVNFLWRPFQRVCLFHAGWLTSTPAHTTLMFSSFWPKTAWPLCSTLPIHPVSTWVTFFCFPGWKIFFKGKHFAHVEEVKQKTTEALKGIKIYGVKNCSEQWEKCLDRCIASNVIWRWLKFKHVRITTQFFINKFHFGGSPSCVCVYFLHRDYIIEDNHIRPCSWLVFSHNVFIWILWKLPCDHWIRESDSNLQFWPSFKLDKYSWKYFEILMKCLEK